MKKIYRLLVIALVIRLVLTPFGTLSLDFNTFVAWSDRLVEYGSGTFYAQWSDYLPGYLYVLWGVGLINNIIHIPAVYLYKLPAIVADLATGWVIYKVVSVKKNQRKALWWSGAYLFNPAILANSTLWGQVDSLTALSVVLSLWLVNINLVLSAVALAVGTLIKPQVVFVVPVLALVIMRSRDWFRKISIYVAVGSVVFMVGFWPFSGGAHLIGFVIKRVTAGLDQYPYTSVNAFNFWGFLRMWQPDNVGGALSFRYLGYYLTAGLVVVAVSYFWRKKWLGEKGFEYYLATVLLLTTYLFMTRMHERHMLPTFAPLAVVGAFHPGMIVPYVGLSLIYVANMFYSYWWINNSFSEVFSPFVIKAIGAMAVFCLGWMVVGRDWVWWKGFRIGKLKKEKKLFEKMDLRGKGSMFLGVILVFSLVSRFLFLDAPKHEYFDEIYHAFTAKVMLHRDPKAWEWWNPHPTGFAYEWTHPPMAKIGMVGGMKIIGEKAIGWRAPAALLGVGVVYLVYLIAKELFDDELVGILSAGVMALDGLVLVMSRIGMNDMYFLLFMLCSFYFFAKEKNFWSAVALGFAAASKWTFLWFLPVLGIGFLSLGRKFKWSLGWYFLLPPLIYVGSYLGMFLSGHGWDIFIGVQKQMWWYHTNLVAEHPYTSPWWSWPLMLRPIWLFTAQGESAGSVRNIYAMGNPVVFWSGLAAVIYVAYLSFLKKSRRLGLLVFSYLVFFVSWAVSPRIMFLYHYLPSVRFMTIAIGVFLRKNTKLIGPFFGLAIVVFVYFYPHWTGIAVPTWLDKSYYWFSSWR